MRASALIAVAAVVSLSVAGCTAPPPVPTETPHPGPPARTHWELRHRLLDTAGLRVVGQQLDAGGESTTVRLTDPATAVSEDCYVALSVPGEGGPENRVGEQTSTTYDGHPAVRSGAGAEADYLMWRLEDDSWVEVSCGRFDSWTSIERVAAAVDLEPTPIMIPFDVELPDGYGVAAISNDLDQPSGRVHLGRLGRQPWSPEAELDVAYGAPELSTDPPGEHHAVVPGPGRRHLDQPSGLGAGAGTVALHRRHRQRHRSLPEPPGRAAGDAGDRGVAVPRRRPRRGDHLVGGRRRFRLTSSVDGRDPSDEQLPDLTARTVIVTGATSGVGRATAAALVGAGARVVLAVRNQAKGDVVAADLGGITEARVEVRTLDLADLSSVRRFAADWNDPIDVLINNAGVMATKRSETADGFERQPGTNHLGHFLLPRCCCRRSPIGS